MQEEQDTSKNNFMGKFINKKNYSFLLSNWRKLINGITISQNENIICIIKNPVDYVIDGLTFINTQKIKEIILSENIFQEEIINSKFISNCENDKRYINFKFKNFKDLFIYLKKTSSFCELSLRKANVIYIGKIINVNEESIDIDFYDVNFKLMDNAYIEYKDISLVNIFTDYAGTIENIVLKGKKTKVS